MADQVFDVVCVPIGRYRDAGHPELPADEEADEVAAVLAELGGTAQPWPLPSEERHRTNVDDRLSAWSTPPSARNSVMYWVGHGGSDGIDAWLATWDSPNPIGARGVQPEALADHIRTEWGWRHGAVGTWAIVVIEACGAKRFVQRLSSVLQGRPNVPERLAMIGVSSDGAGHLGEFRHALRQALGSYTDNDEHIRLDDLVSRVRGQLHEGWVQDLALHDAQPFPRRALLPGTVTAPVDIYRELRAFLKNLSADERGHFIPKAQGAEQGELAWYFVGRATERAGIARWLRERSAGMLVVTGPAGSGKSALLGNVLVHTNPELRELLQRAGHLQDVAADERPPDRAFDTVISLTGMTVDDVVHRLSQFAGLTAAPDASPDLEVLLRRLAATPFTLLADALDEAQEPEAIAASVLKRIAELPAGRVVVGTRRSTTEGPDQPDPADENLLDALGREASTTLLGRDPAAIATYVRLRLAAAREAGTLAADDAAIDRVVETVGAGSRQFLFARLAVHELLARPTLLAPENADRLATLLRRDHRALFAAAVDRLAEVAPVNLALLEALALAQGRGLPRAHRIWAIVATALTETPVTETDIDELLIAAAPYVMLDAEDGQSVYRLAHAVFREHFVIRPTLVDQHRRVAGALIEDALARLPAAPNQYLTRHLSAHIGAADAWPALAETTDLLDHLDPDSVAADAFRSAFGRTNLPAGIAAILASRHQLADQPPPLRVGTRQLAALRLSNALVPAPHSAQWTVRWARLRNDPLHMVLFGHTGAVRAMITGRLPDGRVLLVTTSDDGTARVWDPSSGEPAGPPLTGHAGPINAVTVVSRLGHPLLVTGDEGGTVRWWDPLHGKQIGAPGRMHDSGVTCLVTVPLPKRQPMVASAGADGRVLLWDPATLAVVTPFLGDSSPVTALLVLLDVNGRTMLAAGTKGGTVWLWDLAEEKPAHRQFAVHSPVTALTEVRDGDGTRLLAASSGGVVHTWSLRTFRSTFWDGNNHFGAITALTVLPNKDGNNTVLATASAGRVRLSNSGTRTSTEVLLGRFAERVSTLAALSLPDRTLLAVGGNDRNIELWDIATGERAGSALSGHTDAITTMVPVALADGRTLLAAGGADGTVRLWDPGTAQLAGRPLVGHTDWVNAVAAVPLPDGSVVVATGGHDRTVRLWNPATGDPVGRPLTGHTGAVVALTALPSPNGQSLLATAGTDHTIRLWDLVTATQVGSPLTGHTERVNAIAPVSLPGGPTFLASASADGTVRLWDPTTGLPVGQPFAGHTGPVLAVTAVTVAPGRVLVASGGDDGTILLWYPTTGELAGAPLTGHTGAVTALAAMPTRQDHMLLASGGKDRTVLLWSELAGDPVAERLGTHRDWVTGLAAVQLPDGTCRLASTSHDHMVELWDPVVKERVGRRLSGHTDWVNAVAPVPMHGRMLIATAGNDRTVRLWDPTIGYSGGATAIATLPLPDRRALLASAGTDGTVRLWDSASGEPVADLPDLGAGRVTRLTAMAMPDGQTVLATSGRFGRTVRLWDPANGRLITEVSTRHENGIAAVAGVALPDGRTAIATAGISFAPGAGLRTAVRLWDSATGKAIRGRDGKLGLYADVTAIVATRPDKGLATLVVGSADGSVRFWTPGLAGHVVWGPRPPVIAATFLPLPDGLVAIGDSGGEIVLWDPRDRARVGAVRGHEDRVTALTALAMPDGRIVLASGSQDQTIRLWDLATRKELLVLVVGSAVNALSPLPGAVAAALDDGIAVVDLNLP